MRRARVEALMTTTADASDLHLVPYITMITVPG
jgi:hypothetical protein